jgi:hypothetical protein
MLWGGVVPDGSPATLVGSAELGRCARLGRSHGPGIQPRITRTKKRSTAYAAETRMADKLLRWL